MLQECKVSFKWNKTRTNTQHPSSPRCRWFGVGCRTRTNLIPNPIPRTNPFPGCSASSTTQLTYAASINYSCRLSCTEILVSVQPRCQDSGCRQDPGSSLQFLPLTEPGWAMRLFSTGLETRCNAQKPQEQFKQTHLATITINILKLHRDMSV